VRLAICIAGITCSENVLNMAYRGASRLSLSLSITRRNSGAGNDHALTLNLIGQDYRNFDDLLL
jgi:hypothetical protein